MRSLVIGLTVLALGAGLAHAAEEPTKISNHAAIVEVLTIDALAAIVREIGAADVKIQEADGVKSITFVDGDIPYSLSLVACEDKEATTCYGFTQLVLLDDKPTYTYEALNVLNRDTLLLTLFKDDVSKGLGIARVELTDGGVTRQHIAAALTWFVIEMRETVQKLNTAVIAGVQSGTQQLSQTPADRATFRKPTPQDLARITKTLMGPHKPLTRLPK
jgi:hypothetical protein